MSGKMNIPQILPNPSNRYWSAKEVDCEVVTVVGRIDCENSL
ncbi:hypothetical protein SV7mr_19920 [Stieleria bergensis]|uniref:Uncharacterized protein n=1 Tax=Stieleria bergensis TaxID=2528025 RepID=A0A517STM8_9BACT|nr:hypothetical protein SV7mr_19920 [Planctomycetes bacterium SV_7m_r]